MRRRFNARERFVLKSAAQNRCERCGILLPKSWHGDHVKPFASGGLTDVFNGQAFCPQCNLIKGAKSE